MFNFKHFSSLRLRPVNYFFLLNLKSDAGSGRQIKTPIKKFFKNKREIILRCSVITSTSTFLVGLPTNEGVSSDHIQGAHSEDLLRIVLPSLTEIIKVLMTVSS